MKNIVNSDIINNNILIALCILVIFSIILAIIKDFFKKPFKYPMIRIDVNLTGKRQPSYNNYIDEWIIRNKDIDIEARYKYELEQWDNKCEEYLKKTLIWRRHKRKLYEEIREKVYKKDYTMFFFVFYRNRTRYKQINYERTPYIVPNTDKVLKYSLPEILSIDDELKSVNYESTREKYNSKNQRKLMTKELRNKIKERDNYTCQICGKYMPDEVGLQIDHIISIKKGGKTVESNLQVLCDKCNLSKGKN